MTTTHGHRPGSYDIRVLGHLDLHWAERFGVPELIHEADGTTLLRGVAPDQAALHGLLQRVRDLGVPLISVILIPANPSH